MNLRSGTFLWPDVWSDPIEYPKLDRDISCEALVIGGGWSGALAAYELHRRGVDTVLVDRRTIGGGSTTANTGLLQYASDKPLTACMNSFGAEAGARFYRLCREAIDELERLCAGLAYDPLFRRRPSLYCAGAEDDVPQLRAEYEALKARGFDVEYWPAERIGSAYSFRRPGAIRSVGDAEIDPYRFVRSVVRTAAQSGMRVYEHTEASRRETQPDGNVWHTPDGHRIFARHTVVATGYEAQRMRRNANAVLSVTYAIATEPLPDLPGWFERSLIWETARPYLYARTTADNRIVAGGLDERTTDPAARDRLLPRKARLLLERLRELFPQAAVRPAYAWSAVFGSTHDGLPLIGRQAGFPHCCFSLTYGGNGMAYSMIAARIAADLLLRGSHPDEELFRFDRAPGKPITR